MGGTEIVEALKNTGMYNVIMYNLRLGWLLAIIFALLYFTLKSASAGDLVFTVIDMAFLVWAIYSAITLDLREVRMLSVIAGILQSGLLYIPLLFGFSLLTVLLGIFSFILGSLLVGYDSARLLTQYTNQIFHGG